MVTEAPSATTGWSRVLDNVTMVAWNWQGIGLFHQCPLFVPSTNPPPKRNESNSEKDYRIDYVLRFKKITPNILTKWMKKKAVLDVGQCHDVRKHSRIFSHFIKKNLVKCAKNSRAKCGHLDLGQNRCLFAPFGYALDRMHLIIAFYLHFYYGKLIWGNWMINDHFTQLGLQIHLITPTADYMNAFKGSRASHWTHAPYISKIDEWKW